MKEKKMLIFFLTPALIFFVFIFLYPIIRTTIMSFFAVESVSDPVSSWRFVGLDNFVFLMKSPSFRASIINMGKIWFFGGIATLSVSLLFAVILTSGIRAKAFWRAVIYAPNIINAVAMAIMWIQYVFQKRFGFLHNLFSFLGFENLAKIDYMNGTWKFWSLLIAFCFGSVGYFMLIYISGIEKIPKDYFEAATIDGASKFKQFTHITLPLIKGVFRSCMIFWTVAVTSFFVWSQLWENPNLSGQATITPFVYMYIAVFGTQAITERNAGSGAAVGILMTVCVLVVFFVIERVFKNDNLEY